METITLRISPELAAVLEARASSAGFTSIDEFVEDLIRRGIGWEPQWIEKKLLEALDSLERGEGILWTPELAERTKQELLQRIGHKRGEVA